jgi:conjugative transfer region protein TrbK
MSLYRTPRQFARIAAAGFVVLFAALAVIRGQRGEDAGTIVPLEREEANALASEVTRCRRVTLDQTASLENCRRVWAESRRQFFRPTKTPPAPAGPVPTAAAATAKNGDRVFPVEVEHQPNEVR